MSKQCGSGIRADRYSADEFEFCCQLEEGHDGDHEACASVEDLDTAGSVGIKITWPRKPN